MRTMMRDLRGIYTCTIWDVVVIEQSGDWTIRTYSFPIAVSVISVWYHTDTFVSLLPPYSSSESLQES
jgi:hypothetical protein